MENEIIAYLVKQEGILVFVNKDRNYRIRLIKEEKCDDGTGLDGRWLKYSDVLIQKNDKYSIPFTADSLYIIKKTIDQYLLDIEEKKTDENWEILMIKN